MASQVVAILSVFGVLGTAGAAMAVNSDTLAGAADAALGNATSVLVPSGAETPASTEPGAPAPISSTTVKKIVVQGPAPAPGASTPIQVAPSVPVEQPPTDGTTGGSGYEEDEDEYEDEDEDEDEDDEREVDDDSYEEDED